jgi:hypothetical protein
MTIESEDKVLSTADLVAAAEEPIRQQETAPSPALETPAIDEPPRQPASTDAQLAALFLPDVSADFRARWDAVQIGFVDDPIRSVRQADELVAQVMMSLAETFAAERAKLEGQLDESVQASTENLRVALRNYRSFFQRLLSI